MKPYDKITKLLSGKGIAYREIKHDPIFTIEDSTCIANMVDGESAKALLLKTKQTFVLVVLMGHSRLDSKKFKKLTGVRDIRFATPAEVKQQMDCIVGSCHPFGRLCGVETYADERLLYYSHMTFSPGLHTKSIRLKTEDYINLEKPTLAYFSD